jgi:hypothetical protein
VRFARAPGVCARSQSLDAFVAGIWTKDLKIRSNLQQPQARHAWLPARSAHARSLTRLCVARQINKCLKSLEQRKLIKAVKSVASSNRKVYMLYELEPSREITGGAWHVSQRCFSFSLRVLTAPVCGQQVYGARVRQRVHRRAAPAVPQVYRAREARHAGCVSHNECIARAVRC